MTFEHWNAMGTSQSPEGAFRTLGGILGQDDQPGFAAVNGFLNGFRTPLYLACAHG
jgi:hypothetical protein